VVSLRTGLRSLIRCGYFLP